jgi:uncharacterized membrane protein YcaP (DUF421 family)
VFAPAASAIVAAADSWLSTRWSTAGWIVLSGLLMLVILVTIVRVIGPRSLARMSSFDFAVTVALGSILGSVVASSTSIAEGILAIGSLLAVQWLIAQFRRRSFGSRADVDARLRQENVHRMDEVIAVILETTGDVSVVHGEGLLDAALYADVREFRPEGRLTPDEP